MGLLVHINDEFGKEEGKEGSSVLLLKTNFLSRDKWR